MIEAAQSLTEDSPVFQLVPELVPDLVEEWSPELKALSFKQLEALMRSAIRFVDGSNGSKKIASQALKDLNQLDSMGIVGVDAISTALSLMVNVRNRLNGKSLAPQG